MQILTLVFILDVAGTADWHYLRKFSLTSSQAHKAFILAFPDYRTNESWVAVGRYLYGDDWKEKLNVVDNVGLEVEGLEVGTGVDDVDVGTGVGVGDEGGILTIRFYLNQIVPDEGDLPTYDALNLAKKYVGTVMPDNEGEENDEEIETNGVGGELVIGSEVEAKGVISELSSATRKRLFTLLAEHVEVQY